MEISAGYKILQFVIGIMFIVLIHEFGHFIMAKIFGVRVKKFYIFFNPWFSVFKKKIGETEFGIGWLPLGGYVQIEGTDPTEPKQSEYPSWHFRAKPLWQKILILSGGALFNIISAIIVITVAYLIPTTKINWAQMPYGIKVTDSLGYMMGLKDGDIILKINNKDISSYGVFTEMLNIKEITIKRNGDIITLPVDPQIHSKIRNAERVPFIWRFPLIIDSILPEKPAQKCGLQKYDLIIMADSFAIHSFEDFKEFISQKEDSFINLVVKRGSDTLKLLCQLDSQKKLGFFALTSIPEDPKNIELLNLAGVYIPTYTNYASLGEALTSAFATITQIIELHIHFIKKLFTKTSEVKRQVTSIVGIYMIFPEKIVISLLAYLIGVLSVALAFINILPIPQLDGGFILLYVIEKLFGNYLTQTFYTIWQFIGVFLLIILLIIAVHNDIVRFFL